jgi:glucokinase
VVTLVIGGDIGGTKTRLCLFEVDGEALAVRAERTFSSPGYPALDDIVRDFLALTGARVELACFGIAGPVAGRTARTTNLAWRINAGAIERAFGIRRVRLINDLEATAWGIGDLGPDDFCELQAGAPAAVGNRAVIAAGTGLGEAGLFWDGRRHRPWACEGGHTCFAPRNELEIELLRFLGRRFPRVSWERVVSGRGLVNIYDFLLEHRDARTEPWLAEEMATGDPARAISQAARSGRSELCAEAVGLFVSLYGAEAGDLALKVMAKGGVFLGGGIAPKMLEELKKPAVLESFLAKGRMRPLLEAMAVRVILDDRAALAGTARAVLED